VVGVFGVADLARDLGERRSTGLDAVETRDITVQPVFADFDDFWTTSVVGSSVGPIVAAMPSGDVERLKTRVCTRLPADAAGRITYSARANAVKGCVLK
jgi:hypothetical protein